MAHILDVATIVEISHQLKKQGNKIVFAHGAFDLLHRGHSTFLKEAKKRGDILVVGVDPDYNIKQYKSILRPIIGQKDRTHMVSIHESTDFVFILDELEYSNSQNPEYFFNLYKIMNPNIVAFGRNFKYKNQFSNRKDEIAYEEISHIYDEPISTTSIIKRIIGLAQEE